LLANFRALETPKKYFNKLQISAQSFVFDSMLAYIKDKLNNISFLTVWSFGAEDIPKFSLTPQGMLCDAPD
jgi:uncharacterized membrane protein YeiB